MKHLVLVVTQFLGQHDRCAVEESTILEPPRTVLRRQWHVGFHVEIASKEVPPEDLVAADAVPEPAGGRRVEEGAEVEKGEDVEEEGVGYQLPRAEVLFFRGIRAGFRRGVIGLGRLEIARHVEDSIFNTI